MYLTDITHILEIETSAAQNLDWFVSYVDLIQPLTDATPGSGNGQITTATTTTIVAAPAASTTRLIKRIIAMNVGAAVQTVKFRLDISGTERVVSPLFSLQPGQCVIYTEDGLFNKYDAGGINVQSAPSIAANSVPANSTTGEAQPTSLALALNQLVGRGASGNVAAIALGTNLSMTGATLNAANGASWTTIEKHLGTTPKRNGKFTITDAAINSSSRVVVMQAPGPYTGKGTRADEGCMDQIDFIAIPGSGVAEVCYSVRGHVASQSFAQGGSILATRTDPIAQRIGRVWKNIKIMYLVSN